MRVIFNTIFFTIIIIAFAAPYAAGFIIEKRYNNMIAQLNVDFKDKMVFTGSFERGFYSSNATTTIGATDAEKMTLEHTIYHGPLAFKYSGFLQASNYLPRAYGLAMIETKLAGKLADQIAKIYGNSPAYVITTIAKYNGDLQTSIVNYPLEVKINSYVKLLWQGLNADINMNKSMTNVNGTVTMPSLDYMETQQDGSVKLLNVVNAKFDFNRTMNSTDEILNLTVAKLKIGDSVLNPMTVENISIATNKKIIDKLLALNLKVTFDKMHIAHDDFGPFMLAMDFSNINSAVIQQVMQSPMPASQQDVVSQTMNNQAQLVAFLSTRPVADTHLTFSSMSGNMDFNSHLAIGGPSIVNLDPNVISSTVDADKKIQVSTALVNMVLYKYGQEQFMSNAKNYANANKNVTTANPYLMDPAQRKDFITKWSAELLNNLKDKKIIIEQNDIVIIELKYVDSNLTINGALITPEEMHQIKAMLIMPPLEASAPTPEASVPTPVLTTTVTTAPMAPSTPSIEIPKDTFVK